MRGLRWITSQAIRQLLTKKTGSDATTHARMLETVKKSSLLHFIAYYHRHAALPLPSSLTHIISTTKSIRTHTLAVPAHTLDMIEVEAAKVSVVCNRSVENASLHIHTAMVSALLRNVDMDFVERFAKATRSAGKQLDDQLDAPLKLAISADQALKITQAVGLIPPFTQTSIATQRPAQQQPVLSHYIASIPFRDQHPTSTHLPIHSQYATILETIHNSQVTIISAETGAGKTTQIPQFILSSYLANSGALTPPRIIVTQPRKIAATSVAERVASERGEQLGVNSAIGYAVRFDETSPTNTTNGSAVFCTTGVLLRKLQTSPLLDGITHVVIDEVHERDLNTDLLLSIIFGVLRKRKDLRVILMSATADTSLFQRYFREFGKQSQLPPVINVLGKCFPVQENYLGHIQKTLASHKLLPTSIQPFFNNRFSPRTHDEKTLYLRVMQATIEYISRHRPAGAILVFLSGWQEISFLKNELLKDSSNLGYGDVSKFRIFAMHSSVPVKDQKEAFHVYERGVRKIILATNIAETSITIKDVVYVVDSGLMKVMRFDSSKQLSTIQDERVSQSNTRQRIGRAGRVQSGEYYSMLSHETRQSLPHSITTEIQRCDLQSTVLQLKSMQLDALAVLQATPEPPHPAKITDSISRLEQLGAIDKSGSLTTKGTIMAKLPLLPWIANLIIQGVIYKCLDPLLTIAAIISTDRSPFSYNPEIITQARTYIRKHYARSSNSDQITALNAITQVFASQPDIDRLSPAHFDQLYLKKASVLNIAKAKAQFYDILEQSGIYCKASSYPFNAYAENEEYVKAVFGKCLYPNVGLMSAKNTYKGKARGLMRLTGGSVNSFSAQVESGEGPETESDNDTLVKEEGEIEIEVAPVVTQKRDIKAVTPPKMNKKKQKAESVRLDELKAIAMFISKSNEHIWNFRDISTQPISAPVFPRLLMYQELQQIDQGLFMRNTSELSPLALTLLTSARIRASDEDSILVDGWLDFEMVETSVETVEVFRSALVRYESAVVDTLLQSGGREVVQGEQLHAVLVDVLNN